MLLPGILAALLLVLVRTVAMFELTRAAFCQSDADRSPRQTAADHRIESVMPK
jgi:hypothetical protein